MKNIKILLIVLFGLSLISCTRKDENSNCQKQHPYETMQRVRLFDKDGNWIDGIGKAKVELIAYDAYWKNPLFDEKGNTIKQIPERIEAKKIMNKQGVHWVELYMKSTEDLRKKKGVVPSTESYFILKINNDSFGIRSEYILDFCRKNILKSFFFSEKQYPAASLVDITIP